MKKSKIPTKFTIVRKRGYEVDRQKRNWKGTWKEALTDLWSYIDCIFYTIFVYKENKSVINWVFYSQPFNILKQTQWLNQVLSFKVLRCTGGLREPKTLGIPWCCGSHCWLAFVFWWGLLFSVFSVFCIMSFADCINLQPQETTKTF